VAQQTFVGSESIDIPDLPGDLDAFPVYRVVKDDAGREVSRRILRLEVRGAMAQRTEGWRDALAAMSAKDRQWLLKAGSGQAKGITERFGSLAIELLYQWCASGIVVFQTKVPHTSGATHGALVNWRLAGPVQDHVQQTADQAQARRAELAEEARLLASELAPYPGARLLAEILANPSDHSYLEHAIPVARDYHARQLAPRGERPVGDTSPWVILACLSRGQEKEYAKDPRTIGEGGQGSVRGAVHKPTGIRVAFKRLRFYDDDSHARMRREIDAGQRFGDHPNVMPVLDADPEGRWFTMPLADGTAAGRARELQETDALRDLIAAVCKALRRPHEEKWIHRDIKPGNLLFLEGRWTVGDWGLGRRPRGETSDPNRTRSGTGFGTEGFAAPELSEDAHKVTAAADIYSLGQVIGAMLTGRRPQANIPLLPPPGPWRTVVEQATRSSPADRPQNVDEFLSLLKHLP
jgi:hypothetical protein